MSLDRLVTRLTREHAQRTFATSATEAAEATSRSLGLSADEEGELRNALASLIAGASVEVIDDGRKPGFGDARRSSPADAELFTFFKREPKEPRSVVIVKLDLSSIAKLGMDLAKGDVPGLAKKAFKAAVDLMRAIVGPQTLRSVVAHWLGVQDFKDDEALLLHELCVSTDYEKGLRIPLTDLLANVNDTLSRAGLPPMNDADFARAVRVLVVLKFAKLDVDETEIALAQVAFPWGQSPFTRLEPV